jgi:phosphoglycerol transferase
VLQLWNASISVPFLLGGDATENLVVIKDVITHGWYLTNPGLAAPFGQELYDFPAYSGDSLYLLMIKLLGVPFGNPAVVMNLFFLLGFPLIAITCFAILRRLGISIDVALVCAALYALLPSRFLRGEGHIFLGAYFMVPICCYLVLALLKGDELFGRRANARGMRAYLTWRTAGVIALCLVVSCSDTYFAAFTVALMAGATIIASLARRSRRVLVCGLAAAAIVLAGIALNGLPNLIYTAEHGKDALVARRSPAESEVYGLSLANLVLPIEDHRVPALASLAKEFHASAVAATGEAAWDSLGLAGTLGLLGLVLALCVRCLRGPRDGLDDSRAVHAALAASMAFLIGTVGGLATLFAYIVSPQLRAPNRISIFIGFFAIFGVALGLDHIRRRWAGRRRGRIAIAALLAAVLVLGALDQTSPEMAPDYATEIAEYHSDGAFVHEIEVALPADAMIYQIPYVPFPEPGPINRAVDYDEMLGYVHSRHLRWSAGALVGRSTDWAAAASELPLAQMLEEVAAIGFSGVYVDTFALPPGGERIISGLHSELGVAPLISPEGRFYFFDMRRYDERLRSRRPAVQLAQLARAALHPEAP